MASSTRLTLETTLLTGRDMSSARLRSPHGQAALAAMDRCGGAVDPRDRWEAPVLGDAGWAHSTNSTRRPDTSNERSETGWPLPRSPMARSFCTAKPSQSLPTVTPLAIGHPILQTPEFPIDAHPQPVRASPTPGRGGPTASLPSKEIWWSPPIEPRDAGFGGAPSAKATSRTFRHRSSPLGTASLWQPAMAESFACRQRMERLPTGTTSATTAFASQPIAVDGWLYAGTVDGRVVAYDSGDPSLTGWPMLGGSADRQGRSSKEGT